MPETSAQFYGGCIHEHPDFGIVGGCARRRVSAGCCSADAAPRWRPRRGMGRGGAAIEAELLDSQSGEPFAALVETRLARRMDVTAGWAE